MYVYELSRVLAARGHGVIVVSPHIGGELTERARANGVEVLHLDADIANRRVDVLHLNQAEPSRAVLRRFPRTPAVATIHSPHAPERPLYSNRIHTYIAVRPDLRELLVGAYGLPRERIALIYNGVDFTRFKPCGHSSARPTGRKMVLFAGTMSGWRRAAALDLIRRSQREGFEVRFRGMRVRDYLDDLPPNVTFARGETWHMEREVQSADETASVHMGRTTIEGWACGKPGWIYEPDTRGKIHSVALFPPPPAEVMAVFDVEHVADEFERLYQRAVMDWRSFG